MSSTEQQFDSDRFEKDLKALCVNFANCLEAVYFEIAKEADNPLAASLHQCLVLTDELHTLAELIRSDTNASTDVIATFSDRCTEIETLFKRIDALQEFVANTQEHFNALEATVSKAEKELLHKK
uniref:Uncharacterized protein n=1 Tax=Plectus sambesii TaxID=2011161 RepID=A0A914V461_9BILA